MPNAFKCPRCGAAQPPSDTCRKCGVNIPRYIEIQKRRSAKPDITPQPEARPKEKPASVSTRPKTDPSGLTAIGDLFKKTWEIYKARGLTLIGIGLLSFVFFALPFGIFFGTGFLLALIVPVIKGPLVAVFGIIGGLAGTLGLLWGIAASVFAVTDEGLGVVEALKKGWRRLRSFIWLFLVLGFIISGGFLLLLIPGIIFTIWFAFAQFILADDDTKGMNALLKSKEYVRGRWFDIFLRFLAIWAISMVLGVIPFVGPVLSFLFLPFMMIFVCLIYRDLKVIRGGDAAYKSTAGEKFKWIGIGCLGYIVFIIVMVIVLLVILGTAALSGLMLLQWFFHQQGIPFKGFAGKEMIFPADELDGTWVADKKFGNLTVIVKGKGISIQSGVNEKRLEGSFTLDKSKEPKRMDVKITASTEVKYVGETAPGIYKLEGGILTLCMAEPGSREKPFSFAPTDKFPCFDFVKSQWPSAGPPVPEAPPPSIRDKISKTIWVYIYSLNYEGTIRLDGKVFCRIKRESDANYNYTTKLPYGAKTFDVEYSALPDSPDTEMRIKIFRYNNETQSEDVLNEWVITDKSGRRTFEITAGGDSF
jgi:uncharacterized protein (TIGR03067 family)